MEPRILGLVLDQRPQTWQVQVIFVIVYFGSSLTGFISLISGVANKSTNKTKVLASVGPMKYELERELREY